MMRDRFFSMPRFLDYCQKDLVENWRTNVLRLVVMYGAPSLGVPGPIGSQFGGVPVWGCTQFRGAQSHRVPF